MDPRIVSLVRIATEAGNMIMPYWGSVSFGQKKDKSIVTYADELANDYMRREAEREFGCYILTEETEESANDVERRLSSRLVIVGDPIDGSRDFVQGQKDFCIMLALVEYRTPVAGVIYEPVSKRALYGDSEEVKMMIEGEEVPLPYLPKVEWSSARVGDPKNYLGDKYQRLYKIMGIPDQNISRSGSMGTRISQILRGEIEMILGYSSHLYEWDYIAGYPLLIARERSVIDRNGNSLLFNQAVPRPQNGIFVFPSELTEEGLERLKPAFDKIEFR